MPDLTTVGLMSTCRYLRAKQGKFTLFQWTRAGLVRRVLVTGIVAITASLSGAVAAFCPFHELWLAIIIAVISLLAFTGIAFLTYDCARAWRAVDYPWILASLIAAIVAIANITQSSLQREISLAKSSYGAQASYLHSSFQRIHSSHCRNPDTSSQDICKRLERIIYYLEDAKSDLEREVLVGEGSPSHHMIWRESKELLAKTETGPSPLKNAFLGYDREVDRLGKLEETWWNLDSVPEDSMRTLSFIQLVGEDSQYWYLVLSFFVGLRLSRTTAELLQSRRPSNAQARLRPNNSGEGSAIETITKGGTVTSRDRKLIRAWRQGIRRWLTRVAKRRFGLVAPMVVAIACAAASLVVFGPKADKSPENLWNLMRTLIQVTSLVLGMNVIGTTINTSQFGQAAAIRKLIIDLNKLAAPLFWPLYAIIYCTSARPEAPSKFVYSFSGPGNSY